MCSSDLAEVDLARRVRGGDVERAVERVGDLECADEVAAGAPVDDRELDVVDSCDPVHDLVHRAVAADGDDQARAADRSLVGELRQVLGTLGEKRVAGEAAVGRVAGNLGPALAGRSSVGGGVDEEGGGANGLT